jgi:GntR family transcriptional regulator of arabinose operon
LKKYELVMQWVKNSISDGQLTPGDKLPSETELISKFNISRNSIRQAINTLIREEIVESRKGIGTFILRKNSRKSYDIGFVCYQMSSYIFPKIISGCNKIIQKNGYNLIINESFYDVDIERQILNNLLNKNVEGLILIPMETREGRNNSDLLKVFEEKNIPVILLDNYFPEQAFATIALDDFNAGRKAAEFLWEKNHRNIGVIYSSDYYPKRQRLKGILSYFNERSFPIEAENIIELENQGSGIKNYRKIKSSIQYKSTYPTAFVCSSDDEAVILMHCARKLGFDIPKNLSVISFDNSDISNFSNPRLTTLNHPSAYMGELAANLLLSWLNYPEIKMNSKTLINSYVVNRESVLKLK